MLLTLPLAAQEEDSTDVNEVTIESVASDQPLSNSPPTASKSPDSGNTAWMLTATALVLFHDPSGTGFILWWSSSIQKRAVGTHALLYNCLHSLDNLGSMWLQFGPY